MGREGIVDTVLKTIGKTRKVQTATTHFSSLPAYLNAMRIMTTIPRHALAKNTGLTVCNPPIKFPEYAINLLNRRDHDNDPGVEWLKNVVRQVAARPT